MKKKIVILSFVLIGGMIMAYTKIGWQNSPSVATPITAGNLEHMDDGIYQAHAKLDEQLKSIDMDEKTLVNDQIGELLRNAYNGKITEATYIMVGDSTRDSNGAHIYKMVKPIMIALNVQPHLSARSGLKAEHWGSNSSALQPGYPQAVDLIPLIPGTGSTTIIDISLGLNDLAHTAEEIAGYIENGINLIKASKPDVIINLTSPNYWVNKPSYNEKLREAYNILVSTGLYGYINVHDNVFKDDDSTEGYYIDNTHPNEYGQKKMAEYIISKLIPEDLRVAPLADLRVPRGYLSDEEINDPIRDSGFRCEVIYTLGKPTGALYLKKIGSDYYLYDQTSGNALSRAIPLENGLNIITREGYIPTRTIIAMVYIENVDILIENEDTTTYYPIVNGVVTEFSKQKKVETVLRELVAQNYEGEGKFAVYKGYLTADSINDAIRDAGIRVEVVYEEGTPVSTLYLNKQTAGGGLWKITESATYGVTSLCSSTRLQQGDNFLEDGSSSKVATAHIYVNDISVLNAVPADDYVFYPITNCVVDEFTKPKTLKQHIIDIYNILDTLQN